MRLALHENLLARGAAFRCAPVFACSVILDVLNPKMFVKTGVFRHSFSCHFFFCVVFKEHFCFGFSPNRFAVPRNVRPRSFTTRSSLFFVTSRPSEKILCKTFCFDLFRLASLLLENARPRSSLRVPRLSFAAPRHTKNLLAKSVREFTFLSLFG